MHIMYVMNIAEGEVLGVTLQGSTGRSHMVAIDNENARRVLLEIEAQAVRELEAVARRLREELSAGSREPRPDHGG